MPALTTYEANRILNASLGGQAYTTNASWLSLETAAGSATGAGQEVTGGSYARQNIGASMGSAASGAIANSTAISFVTMPACTVVSVATYDASTAGNRKWYTGSGVMTSRTVSAGDTVSFAVSALTGNLT